ncbi:hypothetical protein [Marinigracilibium pacificum]|uniref:Lipoprotein n=1 Tax=Marinigracilibium pacificum TaxID=2729599 RepID=A0A848IY49_9BACT|nr:hypothetical protein [Marinigracilibium pacificum]NMM49217.1 hypothetical protein [Marinigracilibium pacificum]
MKNLYQVIVLSLLMSLISCGGETNQNSENQEEIIEVPEMTEEQPNFWEQTINDVDLYEIDNEAGKEISLEGFLEEVGPSISNSADIDAVKIISFKEIGSCKLLAFKILSGTKSKVGLVAINQDFEGGILNMYSDKDEGLSGMEDTISNIIYTPNGVRIEMYHSDDLDNMFDSKELTLNSNCELVVN